MRRITLSLAVLAATFAVAACGSGKSSSTGGSNASSNAATSAAPAAAGMPDCGAVQPVWVNLRTKKYHEPGDRAYGRTKHGEYLCPAQATEQGFVRAGGGGRRHHRHHGSPGGYEAHGGYQAGGSGNDDQSGGATQATSTP